MRSIWALIAIAAWCVAPTKTQAFSKCNDFFTVPDELESFIFENGVRDAPMKYYELAQSIRIEIQDDSGRLIPFAKFDGDGQPVIVYPSAFPPVLCRMALATYLVMQDEDWRPMAEAARDAAGCTDSNRPRAICLSNYATDLEQRYRAIFDAQPSGYQGTAYAIATDAVAQFAKHEYAHHLLGHRDRIRAGAIKRIDAEFEADFYALQSGAQSGEAPSAMYYFFKPLADMESYSDTANSADYESGSCRATNVNDITVLFGVAPMLLLDTVEGGGRFRNASDDIGQVAEELAQQPPPTPSADSCGRLAQVVFNEAHGELTRLTALVANYAGVLKASPSDQDTGAEMGLSSPEVFELIDRLQNDSQTFTHLKGLAARALSVLILRVEYAGLHASVVQQVNTIIESSDDVLSGDYGRLLQVKGVDTLYEARGRPLEARLDEAQPIFEAAVTYLPAAAESWMNLALIALARGDCDKAVGLADEAAGHAANDTYRGQAEWFRDTVREASGSGRCAEEAASFAATFAQ